MTLDELESAAVEEVSSGGREGVRGDGKKTPVPTRATHPTGRGF